MDLSFLQKLLGQPDSEEQAYNSSPDELNNPWSKQQQAPQQYPNSPMDPTPFNFDAMGTMNPPISTPQSEQTEIQQPMVSLPVAPQPQQQLPKPVVPQIASPTIPQQPIVPEQKVPEQDILGGLQQQKQQGLMNIGLLSAADQIGRSIAGQGYLPQQKLDVSHLLAQINAPVEDYMQKQKADLEKINLEKAKAQAVNQKMKDDPNSEISRLVRYSAIDNLNKIKRNDLASKISPNMSATQIEDVLGNYNLQNMVTNYETQQNRLEMAKMRYGQQQEAKQEKLNAADEKLLIQANKDITAAKASSRGSFGKMSNILRSAEAIETLISQQPMNKMDSRQIAEVARGLDAMLSQGSATISGTQKLIPSSASGDLSKITEYITNKAQGANQASFVKKMLETVQREKELAKKQIREESVKMLAPYKLVAKRQPEIWSSVLKEHNLPEDIFNQKIHVTNGKETLEIDPADLENAQKDGFRKVGN